MIELERGGEGYERARRDAVWNGRTPERYPDLIVLAERVEDVVAAVRLAGERGMRVGIRSGGHSWSGSHLRDGGMLLDLSRLDDIAIDRESMTAVVGPGFHSISGALEREGLFFPGGHCPGVAVGGYLLQGGFGWNGRVLGPACMSVTAIDVVTADGELVHASEDENADLLWAARGAGPGFFGVVVRFHLRVYQAPGHIANTVLRFPFALAAEVFAWAHEVAPAVAREVELNVLVHRGESGEPEITVIAPTIADSAEQAEAALAFMAECPLRDRAIEAVPIVAMTLSELYDAVGQFYPEGARYGVDNMWTHASAAELMPGIEAIAATLPPAPSGMLWLNWGGASQSRPSMAFSLEDDTYIACYGVWDDAADDERNVAWAEERMRAMEHLASGAQLADENLGRRPARFMADANLARLDELRERYDPEGRFHAWMGRPPRG